MKRFFLALAVTALMAGCSSGVKLDNVPVEDRTATSTTAGTGTAATGTGSGTATDSRVVAPVDLDAAAKTALGPASARVVYFDYDSFVIKPEAQSIIDNNARFLKANASRKAVIEGHTDERGGREYNLALGQKRSEAVRRALGLLGVSDAQLEAVSFGKEKPVATGSDEASMAQNRRAEITYR
jgi:peptidoglycan-associated lipoprotein